MPKKISYYEGRLVKKVNGRWSIFEDNGPELSELSSGSTVEVKIADHWIVTGIERWIVTGIEHGGKDYYATTKGIRLYDGMPARQQRR